MFGRRRAAGLPPSPARWRPCRPLLVPVNACIVSLPRTGNHFWAVVGGRHGTQEDRCGPDRGRPLAATARAPRADLEEATEASLADATGEVGFDEEFADAGSFTFERERDLSLVDNAKDLIDKVEHALGRIDAGTFGRCEACGGAIEAERLDALPYATLCLADARQRVRLR
jgi:RNA polymerase-binding transcription factor DksA